MVHMDDFPWESAFLEAGMVPKERGKCKYCHEDFVKKKPWQKFCTRDKETEKERHCRRKFHNEEVLQLLRKKRREEGM